MKPLTDPALLAGYSPFEQAVIANLAKAGAEGIQSAGFMLENGIHITWGRTWYPNWFSAWWNAKRRLVILDEMDFNGKKKLPGYPFLLNIVAHELDHINITRQYPGSWIPAGLTRYGEIRAWRLGFTVQFNFTHHVPLPGTPIADLLALDLDAEDVILRGSRIIRAHQKRVKHGWLYSFFYSLLPAYPRGYQRVQD